MKTNKKVQKNSVQKSEKENKQSRPRAGRETLRHGGMVDAALYDRNVKP